MKAINLIAVLLLVGCGGPDIDGAHFAWQSPKCGIGLLPGAGEGYFTPEVFDVTAEYYINNLTNLGGNNKRMLEEVQSARVEGREESFQCILARPGDLCNGQLLDYKLIVAKAILNKETGAITPLCVWQSAFGHELMHFLLGYGFGDDDSGHTWKQVWDLTGTILGTCN